MLLFTIVCTISKHKRHIGAENIAKREEVEEEELVPFAFYSIHKEMRIRENSFSLAAADIQTGLLSLSFSQSAPNKFTLIGNPLDLKIIKWPSLLNYLCLLWKISL